jgi:hypothetical protein
VDSWKAYRNTILSDSRVNEVIDSLTTLLDDARQRNFNTFPILGSYVWPNNYVGGTYENEITYLKNWIFDRMAWMDSKLDKHKFPYSTPVTATLDEMDLYIFPNPVVNEMNMYLNIDRQSELQIEIFNVLAQTTYVADFNLSPGSHTLYFSMDMVNKAMPQPGIYYLNLKIDGRPAGARSLVKQ